MSADPMITTYNPREVAPTLRAVVHRLLEALPIGRYGRTDKGHLVAAVLTLLRDDVTYFKTLTIQDGFGRPVAAAALARMAGTTDRSMRALLDELLVWGWLREDNDHGRRSHTAPGRPARMLAWDLPRLQTLAATDWARNYRTTRPETKALQRPHLVDHSSPISGPLVTNYRTTRPDSGTRIEGRKGRTARARGSTTPSGDSG
jgi:hypothetical protein